MERPSQTRRDRRLTTAQLRELAARATYVGSPEHKDEKWWGGLPMARQRTGGKVGRSHRQTTTVCPLTSCEDRDRATGWVRSAIRRRQLKYCEGDKDYPKKIWHRADGRVWFGYCVNSEAGEYKGWPIDEEERRGIFD